MMNFLREQQTLDTLYLDDNGNTVSKIIFNDMLNPQTTAAQPKPQQTCRICLDPCANIKYCACTGGLMTHQQCLASFITVKMKVHKLKSKEMACEICKHPYEVELQRNYSFSGSECSKKVCENRMRCAFYSVFFVAVMLYYGYMGYLFKNNKVSESARAALLIVAVCVCLLSVLFLGVWIYQHLFRITQGTVSKVLSLDERRVRPTPGSCKVHPK